MTDRPAPEPAASSRRARLWRSWPPPPARGPGPGWTHLEKALGLATAFVTLISAALGTYSIYASQQKKEVQSAAVDQADAAQATIDELTRKNADQAARIRQLEAQLSPAPTPGESGSAPIRHAGRVSLADGGDRIDLNAPADDTTWSAGVDTESQDTVGYSSGSLTFNPPRDWARLDGAAGYRACKSATIYAPAYDIPIAELESAQGNCFRLTTGRYATIQIVGSKKNVVTLDITTWEANP